MKLTEFAKGMGLEMWVEATSEYPETTIRFCDDINHYYDQISIFVDEVADVDATVESIQDYIAGKVAETVEVTM